MKGNGLMTKPMDTAFINITMEHNLKAPGKMINKKVLGSKFGLMELNMRETILKAESQGREN
jgi:hypothetical protein